MIQLSNITFGYRKKQILFDNLNLTLEFGKIYGLFGVNGAGKTTLLKQLSGLLKPTEGKITINGLHVGTRDANALETVFLVPEEFELPPISTRRFIELNAPFYKGFDHSLFETSMVEFELGLDENLAAMSYGQKKKFLVSFGLATQTPLLLLDEPTNDIDINTLRALEEGLDNFAGCAVVISHDRWFLDRICTHILSFEGNSDVFYFEGSYSEYEENKRQRLGDEAPKRVRYRKLIAD